MPQVFGYIRFSIEKSEQGMSEADQVERIQAHHARYLSDLPLHPLEPCTDRAVSAYTRRFSKRAGGAYVLEHIRKGDTLIIPWYDRAFRKVWDALYTIEKLQAKGVKIAILDFLGADISTFEGLAALTVGALVSEGHSKRLSERMKSVEATRRKHNLTTSAPPSKILLGFKIVPIRNKQLGTNTKQILFDETKLPLLKKYHDAFYNRTTGEDEVAQRLTDELRDQLGLPRRPFAFIDNPNEKVSRQTIKRAAIVYELVQPYLAAGAHVPYHEIQDIVMERCKPGWRAKQAEKKAKLNWV